MTREPFAGFLLFILNFMPPPNVPQHEREPDAAEFRDQHDVSDSRDHSDEVDNTVERMRGEFPNFLSLSE